MRFFKVDQLKMLSQVYLNGVWVVGTLSLWFNNDPDPKRACRAIAYVSATWPLQALSFVKYIFVDQ